MNAAHLSFLETLMSTHIKGQAPENRHEADARTVVYKRNDYSSPYELIFPDIVVVENWFGDP